jgi:hypothetical protein
MYSHMGILHNLQKFYEALNGRVFKNSLDTFFHAQKVYYNWEADLTEFGDRIHNFEFKSSID